MWLGIRASRARDRSISASPAGASLIQIASLLALTSSFVRPVLTLAGNSSASQPSVDSGPRLWMSSHCSESSSNGRPGLCAAAAAGPDDREPAAQLLALEDELELAVLDRLAPVERGRLRLPRAPVPDDHVAGAVLPRRDDALEVEVLDRVVLDVDRHPADARVEGRALGHGPRHQDALDLEPEVVVEAGRPMALDDEAAGSRRARAIACIGVAWSPAGSGVFAKSRLRW